MPARQLPPAILLIPLACFDPPELDEVLPPLADLGPVDTWAAIDESGPPADDEGPSAADDGLPSEGGAEPDPDPVGPDPALEQLRLTEVLVDPDGTDGGADSPEFIEIANPGPSPVKLDGLHVTATSWPVLDAEELGLVGVELEVGAMLIIRRWTTDVDPALATLDVSGSVVWTGFLHSSGLRNSDGSVILEAGTLVIDQLDYGVDPTPTAGMSMCRIDEVADTWAPCDPSPGLLEPPEDPGVDPEDPPAIVAGAVQIVEVHANPPGSSTDEKYHEFIEIINKSENEVELSGCRIGDALAPDAAGVDPLEHLAGEGGCESPTCLAPGARAIIVGQAYIGDIGGALVLATDDTTLADGGLTNTEPVVLWDSRGQAISTYRLWPDPAGEPLPSNEQPLHRIEPSAEDAPASWFSAPATPGS